MYKVKNLPNGVRLIMVPLDSVASMFVATFIACGSRYEKEEVSGVSHFLEHMVFKGTKRYPSFDDVHVIERMGGIQNAYTSIDVTKYYAKVLSFDWRKTIDVVADLTLEPLLPDAEFVTERKVIIEEMAMYEDDLPSKSEEVFHELMYGDNPLGRRIIGSKKSLTSVNREEMEAYHRQMYKSGDLVVVVSGRIENEREVEEFVEERFGKLKKEKNSGFEAIFPEKNGRWVEVVSKPKAEQANLVLGFPAASRFSSDKYALQVFNLLMGSGFTSRFFKKIREEKGLCYGIRSDVSTYHETGDWSVWAGLDTGRIDEAIEAILKEIVLVLEKGIGEDEAEVAKKRYSAGVAFQMESPESLGEFFGRRAVYGLPLISLQEYLEEINRVTVSDMERVIKKYFLGKSLRMTVVGKYKEKDGERFEKLGNKYFG